MKILTKTLIISLLSLSVMAQQKTQYKLKFAGEGKKVNIVLYQSNLQVQGYDGDEVIVEVDPAAEKKSLPKEAEGLRMITNGVEDNSGIGINAQAEGNSLKLTIPQSRYSGPFIVKLPRNIDLKLIAKSDYNQGFLNISDLNGEIELYAGSQKVSITDVTGPIVAHMGYGKIYVSYSKINQNSPSSINSTGAIDVTLPADSKANVKMKSYYGDIFTDFDLVTVPKKEMSKSSSTVSVSSTPAAASIAAKDARDTKEIKDKEGTTIVSDKKFHFEGSSVGKAWNTDNDKDLYEGTINGGGVSIELKSSNGNIYLRKKK